MKSSSLELFNVNCEGEIGDVVIRGDFNLKGETLLEQSKNLLENQVLRNFLLNEPRGGVFKHFNLLVSPKNKEADAGFIILEPEDNPPMSGSNCICVSTVLLEKNFIQMEEPITEFLLEAPGGIIPIKAYCENKKVKFIEIKNLPSFVDQLDVKIKTPTFGEIKVSSAFGGDSFVMSRASDHGFELKLSEVAELARFGMLLRSAANSQLNFVHPLLPDWKHHSFAYVTGELGRNDLGELTSTNVCVINPGKLDRSPTGTGVSALMAVMHSRGLISVGESFIGLSIIGSQFTGQIVSETELAGRPAIIPRISGRGYIYGTSHFYVDPSDPWPLGYRVADTWPGVI